MKLNPRMYSVENCILPLITRNEINEGTAIQDCIFEKFEPFFYRRP